jgi:hypothetical protein
MPRRARATDGRYRDCTCKLSSSSAEFLLSAQPSDAFQSEAFVGVRGCCGAGGRVYARVSSDLHQGNYMHFSFGVKDFDLGFRYFPHFSVLLLLIPRTLAFLYLTLAYA